MAKSTTKNESAKETFDIEKIKRFTQQELDRLASANSDLPFCYQIGCDILVGRCKIEKINDQCWRVYHQDKQVFDFFNRKDAIYYCIAIHRNQLKVAQEILECDGILNKLEFDAALFRIRYKSAIANRDHWGVDYYSTRYTETMSKIDHIKKEIKKNINLAKYIKV